MLKGLGTIRVFTHSKLIFATDLGREKRTDSRVSIQLFTLTANSSSKEFCIEFNKKHKLLFNYSTDYGLRVEREKSFIEIQLTADPKEYTKLFIDNEQKW